MHSSQAHKSNVPPNPYQPLQRWLAWRLRWLAWGQKIMPTSVLLWSVVVGVMAALITTCTHRLIRTLLLLWQSAWLQQPLGLILFAGVGGLAAAWLLRWTSGAGGEVQVAEPLEAIAVDRAQLAAKPVLVRCGASLLSIVSGASIGFEGVMVQLVAAVMATWAKWLAWAPPRRRLLIGCGVAAAMAAAYKAPIAGALFVAEIVLGTVAVPSFAPLLLSATVAAACMGQYSGEGAYLPLLLPFDPKRHGCNGSLLQMVALLPLAICLGGLAPAFVGGLRWLRHKLERWLPSLPIRMAIVGMATGLLLPQFPMVRGSGEQLLQALFLPAAAPWQQVLLLVLLKAGATMVVVAAGVIGGIFTPILFVGAGLGWLYGTLLSIWFAELLPTPQGCALLALGAFLAATTHAPLMAILLVLEWTLDHTLLLPLIVVTLLAHQLATWLLPRSIYGQADWRQAPAVQHNLSIAPWIRATSFVVRNDASFAEVVAHFRQPLCSCVLVVDSNKHLTGVIWLQTLHDLLDLPLPANLVAAQDIMVKAPAYLVATDDLATALRCFAETGQTMLPVCLSSDSLLLIGWLHEQDVLLGLSQWTARATMQSGTGWRSVS